MKKVEFLPYEEFQIQLTDSQEYIIQTPWLGFQIKVDTNQPDVHETLKAYAAQDILKTNPVVLSNFLKSLNLPIHYILPTQNMQATDEATQNLPSSALSLSKAEFRKLLGLPPATKNEWTWDTDAILDFAKVGFDRYDSLAILSVVRRFHLLDCIDQDKTAALYNYCKTTEIADSKDLDKYLATIAYQNYYVTAQCQTSLAPALKLAQSAEADVFDFMKDEDGHDLLLGRAVTTLYPNMNELYLSENTKNIMSLLKQFGELNFFAFCLAVDFFEKPNFDEIDPLGALMIHFNKTTAADCLQKHKDINDGGEHEGVSINFLKHLKPVSKDYAVSAIRLAEILTDEMTAVTADLLELFKSQQKQ